jgi:centrosomal protein CEP290
LRLRSSEADARAEQALADKEGQMSIAEDLRGEVQEKINLIEEFEDKFTRQFRCAGTFGGRG